MRVQDRNTSSYLGVVACHDTFVDDTVDVTTGSYLCVLDTMGVTTGSYLAILRCDATILVLGGDIVDEATDSLIRLLYVLWMWATMHCVGSMPWYLILRRSL